MKKCNSKGNSWCCIPGRFSLVSYSALKHAWNICSSVSVALENRGRGMEMLTGVFK